MCQINIFAASLKRRPCLAPKLDWMEGKARKKVAKKKMKKRSEIEFASGNPSRRGSRKSNIKKRKHSDLDPDFSPLHHNEIAPSLLS